MAIYNGITIDNTVYDVRIVYGSLQRTAKIVEGRNAGTSLKYRKIRDVQGTSYTYTFDVEPNPANPTAYDNFFEKITTPTDYLTIVVPYGQTTKSFDAYIDSVTDKLNGKLGTYNRWGGCKVTFTSIAPVRLS